MQVVLVLFILIGASAQNILFLSLNSKCRNDTEPWTCKKSSSCKTLKDGVEKGQIEICTFIGTEPVICCPPDPPIAVTPGPNVITSERGSPVIPSSNAVDTPAIPSSNVTASPAIPSSNITVSPTSTTSPGLQVNSMNPGKKAEAKCKEYARYVYRTIPSPILLPGSLPKVIDECAIIAKTLIVGGTPANLKEFPHMALIGLQTKYGNDWFCGGSLISPNFILTAAHCNVSKNIGNVVARLGDLNIKDNKDRARPIEVKIVEAFDHPKYDHSKAYHDISLLKLERDVKLSPHIRPICLQTSKSIVGDVAIASGWGRIAFDNHPSDILQKVELKLVDDDQCKSVYAFERAKLPKGINPNIMFCAGGISGKDTCQGDSGGPLQIILKEPYCMYSVIGLTAFGIGCGSKVPGGYTRISYYIPWIESIVWP